MRHQIKAKHLNRDSNSRKALFKGLVSSLITSGHIQTTEPKAKVIKGLVDKLIHRAQEGSVSTRRVLARFFGRRDVVNELVDKVAPSMKDRKSGYTTITRLGTRRGDNTMLVKMELMSVAQTASPENDKEHAGTKVQEETKKKNTKTTSTKKEKSEAKK